MRRLTHIRKSPPTITGRPWSNEEDAAVREFYPKTGYREVANRFPWRTDGSISRRAHKLGVRGPAPIKAAVPVPHDCEYCGAPIPINGMRGYAYNRKRTCCLEHSRLIGLKKKRESGKGCRHNRISETPELFEALAARDRGDHSLLEAILRG